MISEHAHYQEGETAQWVAITKLTACSILCGRREL